MKTLNAINNIECCAIEMIGDVKNRIGARKRYMKPQKNKLCIFCGNNEKKPKKVR